MSLSCCLTGKNFECSVESTSPLVQAARNTAVSPQVAYLLVIDDSQFFNVFVYIQAADITRECSVSWTPRRKTIKKCLTRNVGQCPSWWPPCQIQVTPSVQCREVWLTLTAIVPCSNTAKTRNPLKFVGVAQTRQQISAVSRPTFTILTGHVEEILLFKKFFSDCRYMP